MWSHILAGLIWEGIRNVILTIGGKGLKMGGTSMLANWEHSPKFAP